MKFKKPSDKICFLSDINRLDLITEDIPQDVFEVFLNQRKPILRGMKDMRKSRLQKGEWIKHRYKIMKGINKFHRSIAGKKMHRSIGSFLTSKLFRPKEKTFEDLVNNNSLLKSISSVKTHLYIESEYYKQIDEQLEFNLFFDFSIPMLSDIEERLYTQNKLTNEQVELLLRLVDKRIFHKVISERCSINIDDINKNIDEQKAGINLEESFSYTLLYNTCSDCL